MRMETAENQPAPPVLLLTSHRFQSSQEPFTKDSVLTGLGQGLATGTALCVGCSYLYVVTLITSAWCCREEMGNK